MRYLFLIPARGGSKGIHNKNIKKLNGKPLIEYSINIAREFVSDDDICLSTDSLEIKQIAENLNLHVPFIRPDYLASDTANSYDVIKHCLDFYKSKGKTYDALVLLQPTSPLRKKEDIESALQLYSEGVDAVLSVCKAQSNPYYVHFIENKSGGLEKLLKEKFDRRQDVPEVYEVNGAVYILNVKSIRKHNSILEFPIILKSEMPIERSADIDDENDWNYVEYLINSNKG